jgi:hypothetical protein
MTAIPSSDLLDTRPREVTEPGPTLDAIRREMLSLRVRVRALAELRTRAAAERFTPELRVLTEDAARAMVAACENRAVLARLRHRLARQVKADLLRAREADEAAVDARVRGLLVDRLGASLRLTREIGRDAGSNDVHENLSLAAARAVRIFEEHREGGRGRFRALKGSLRTELAELAFEMAGETAARLSMRYGQREHEWLWWRLSRIVDQFQAVSTPASLPAALEVLAARAVLSGLQERITPS